MPKDDCLLVRMPSGWFRLEKSEAGFHSSRKKPGAKSKWATEEDSRRAWLFLRAKLENAPADKLQPATALYQQFTGSTANSSGRIAGRIDIDRLLREIELRMRTGQLRFKTVTQPRQQSYSTRDIQYAGPRPEPTPVWQSVAQAPPAKSAPITAEKLSKAAEKTLEEKVVEAVEHETAASKAAHIERPELADIPALAETPTEAVWFLVNVVDQVGNPIAGVEMQFKHAGNKETMATSGAGSARYSAEGDNTAEVTLANFSAVTEKLKQHWMSPAELAREEWVQAAANVEVLEWCTGLEPPVMRVSHAQEITLSLQPRVVQARFRGLYFDTNKCFLLPTALPYVKNLVKLYEENPNSTVLVVGHTDTTDEPSVNDALSLERAQAMAAYMQDDVDAWLAWYGESKPENKRWSAREDKLMLKGLPDYPEKPSGEDPVRWFQKSRGLKVDGVAGPNTRTQLITEYMGNDGTTLPDSCEIEAHGCGENFPMPESNVTTQSAADRLSGQKQRRVELFFFDKALGIQPSPPGPNSPPGSTAYLEWVHRTVEQHDMQADGIAREVTVLEMHDTLFRTNSCVVLPEGEDPTRDTDGHLSLTSVGIIASALRYNEAHPNKKLLIAGHCDTTASVAFNQALSEERASVILALLTGDREAFRNLVSERHQVADYKQILHWVSRALDTDKLEVPFDCDPGTIDNNAASSIEAVRHFQRDYNKNKAALGASAADLSEDGAIGPLTWGAIFDCYEFALLQELGEAAAALQQLRNQLVWVDVSRKALGFSEHHPLDNLGRDNYRSQANRRAEILFFDPGEEPDLVQADATPEMSEIYLPGQYAHEHLEPMLTAKPWRVQWERNDETISMGESRQMQLEAPGLAAGETVMWEIEQLGYGVVGRTNSTATDNAASCPWNDWVFPESTSGDLDLSEGTDFPTVQFQFTATAGGRSKTSVPLAYADRLELRSLIQASSAEAVVPADGYAYWIHTLWGRRQGHTTTIDGLEGCVREVDLPPGGATVVLEDNEAAKAGGASG